MEAPLKILAIIPARGGSKGIPRKNLLPLAAKPLLAHSILHARQTPGITRVVVSTDDAEIASVSREWGAEVVPRPPEISCDKASSESALLHALDYLERAEGGNLKPEGGTAKGEGQGAKGAEPTAKSQERSDSMPQALASSPPPLALSHSRFASSSAPDLRPPTSDLRAACPDLVVFLQATSPMRDPDDIQRALDTFKREDADSLFSACPVHGFIWRNDAAGLRSFTYDHLHRPRRQDAPEDLVENGSIYIFKPWVLRKFNNRLGGKIAVHRMSALDSFQIDEPGDFELMEALMAFKRKDEGGNLKPEGGKGKVGGHRSEVRSQMSEVGCPPSVSPIASIPSPTSSAPSPISHLLSSIRLLALDFDGVLTDNRVVVTEDGKEAVLCDRGDGLGLGMLKAAGVKVMVISKEKNTVVAARCRKLDIECVQGCDRKRDALEQRARSEALSAEQVAFVGNDINDLDCLSWVGLPIAVADALPEVKTAAKWITTRAGGHGAVREVCDLLIAAER
jgi:YrbI family 3-deoxy-D-manno-octulosonate 8-phosphate phosphatase